MRARIWLATSAAAVALVVVAVGFAAGGPGMMGPAHRVSITSFQGYYDGHKDTFLGTDVSSRVAAKAEHINFSAKLAASAKTSEEIYMFSGRIAAGQLPVFSSEPGEKTYTPLWREEIVTWKAGVTPVLVDEDTKIDALKKKGMVTVKETGSILNCPIIKVGKA
jgi:hypothetical protein